MTALNQNYTILNYDFYGQGESGPPKEMPSLSVYARQILDLMDELKIDKVSLVGFSIGGMINRRFALDYPERLNSIVILNSPHERSPEAQKAIEAELTKKGLKAESFRMLGYNGPGTPRKKHTYELQAILPSK